MFALLLAVFAFTNGARSETATTNDSHLEFRAVRRRRLGLFVALVVLECAGALVSWLVRARTEAIADSSVEESVRLAAIERRELAFGPCLAVAILSTIVFVVSSALDVANRRPFVEIAADLMTLGVSVVLTGFLVFVKLLESMV